MAYGLRKLWHRIRRVGRHARRVGRHLSPLERGCAIVNAVVSRQKWDSTNLSMRCLHQLEFGTGLTWRQPIAFSEKSIGRSYRFPAVGQSRNNSWSEGCAVARCIRPHRSVLRDLPLALHLQFLRSAHRPLPIRPAQQRVWHPVSAYRRDFRASGVQASLVRPAWP